MTMTMKLAVEKHKSFPFEIEIRKRGHEERWRVLLYAQTRRHVRTRKEKTYLHNGTILAEISLFHIDGTFKINKFHSYRMSYHSKPRLNYCTFTIKAFST